MHKYNTVWIFRQVSRACATVQAFAVLAALPLGAAELTHRWSFNGDYTSKTYGVEVQTATGFTRLREKNPVNPVNPVQNFPLATPGSKISRIRFDGSGAFRSLVGEWAEKVRAFMIHIL